MSTGLRGAGTDLWVWVSMPGATFTLVVRDGLVLDAAPVARWAVGRPAGPVLRHYRRRGARFAELGGDARRGPVGGP